MTVQPSFIFGGDTGVKTPEELARLRAIADALSRPAAPRNVGEGLKAIGEALGYRMANSRANKAETDWRKGGDSVFSALFGSGADPSTTAPASTASSAPSGSTPALGGSAGSAPNLSGNDIYSGFMDTVKSKITNPNALAAVAATGNAESQFSPGNVFRSWSDPSQSGQAGQAGGIMSWRAERLANMKKFAADNGGDPNRPSPQLQAQYFLQEDPGLIDRLNSAKTPAEAQQMMNNAWKFAGYDRPGGEAGRRIALANSFASQFGNSDQPSPAPVTVASVDPSAGVAQALNAKPAPARPAAPGNAVATALAHKAGLPKTAAPGTVMRGPDEKTYQYAETTGMTGATGASGWIPVNEAALNAGPQAQSPRMAEPAPVGTPASAISQAAPAASTAQQQPVRVAGGPTLQQLMQAAQDPRLSAEQRGVVGIMLKQKMAENDPATQLEMEKNRLDMEKTRIETERLQNPQMTPAEKARLDFDERKLKADQSKLIEVGGSLVDPDTHQAVYTGQQTDWEKLDDGTLYNKRTGQTKAVTAGGSNAGQFRFKGNSVEAQSLNGLMDSNAISEEQAQQLGAGKTISGPNGELMFLTPQGVFGQPAQGGAPQPVSPPASAAPTPAQQPPGAPAQLSPTLAAPQAAPAAPIAPLSPRADNASPTPGIMPLTGPKTKPQNEQQQRDAKLYAVVAPELQIVEDNFKALSNTSDQALSAIPHGSDFGADYLKSSDYQRASNSLKTIIASYLYSVSGATAAPAEVENQASILTPKPGEAQASVDDKLARVRAMVDAIKSSRGGGDAPAAVTGTGTGTTSNGLKWSLEP
ncbi:phage tail tip lysozyme [Mesorhizobium sp. BR1-1-4]|uniref:phage tail tip lysozyme n=1 Tax=Mesorhizobium sp. BR1-1-4 TaxID=2876650 RepID=UPI001CCEEFB0|nr:phage tail tip lysozyme [Mesorhizobium sp. BR1-1-4]MBZ9926777.1 hypothetical protein [Mesorhizobium sp. BR1-1-4]